MHRAWESLAGDGQELGCPVIVFQERQAPDHKLAGPWALTGKFWGAGLHKKHSWALLKHHVPLEGERLATVPSVYSETPGP